MFEIGLIAALAAVALGSLGLFVAWRGGHVGPEPDEHAECRCGHPYYAHSPIFDLCETPIPHTGTHCRCTQFRAPAGRS
ncbi:hypothetical protein [Nocardia vaccinii]|uniref:hypothetical protein n=1 Tax=Nocardia vaccinii TaxID=1822 RepID=UPI00082B65CE|nr:hypothetical protein [Nocardia vaccinii]